MADYGLRPNLPYGPPPKQLTVLHLSARRILEPYKTNRSFGETPMADAPHFDQLETRDPEQRELAQFNLLPDLIRQATAVAPGWADHLKGVDPAAVTSREALSGLPVLRKSGLHVLQARRPPFGGFATTPLTEVARVFMSPGPIFEPQGRGEDWWRAARALYAAGVRRGDVVHNTFAYHLTPGGWILDSGAR